METQIHKPVINGWVGVNEAKNIVKERNIAFCIEMLNIFKIKKLYAASNAGGIH